MTRDDLKSSVWRAADALAYHYSRARNPIHNFSRGLAASGASLNAASGLSLLAKASLAEIDQAGPAFLGLSEMLSLVEKEFGNGAQGDATTVLNVFSDLHKKVAELSVICITSERLGEDLAEMSATDTPALQNYLQILHLRMEKLVEKIAGFDGHQGPVDLIMTLAVSDLKASL